MAKAWLPESHFDTMACRPGPEDRLGDVLARLEGGSACAVLPALPRDGAVAALLLRVLSVPPGEAFAQAPGQPSARVSRQPPADDEPRVAVAPLRELVEKAAREKPAPEGEGGAPLVDTSWCGPWMVRPLQLGASASVSDLSTWLGLPGFAVCARTDQGLARALAELGAPGGEDAGLGEMRGPVLADDPLASVLLATASSRTQRRSDTALVAATYLEAHPAVERVAYPGLAGDTSHDAAHATLSHGSGPLVAFRLASDAPDARAVLGRARASGFLAPASDGRMEASAPADRADAPASAGQAGASAPTGVLGRVCACDRTCLLALGARDLLLRAGCETTMDVVGALEECLGAWAGRDEPGETARLVQPVRGGRVQGVVGRAGGPARSPADGYHVLRRGLPPSSLAGRFAPGGIERTFR